MANFNVIGLGASSLNNDVLTKLKENDIKLNTKHINDSLLKVNQKENDFTFLKDIFSELKTSFNSIDNNLINNKNISYSNGTIANFKINPSSPLITGELEVSQLAKKDIYSSQNSYNSRNELLGSDLNININGKDFNFTSGNSIQNVVDSINNSDLNIKANLYDIDGKNNFKLILESKYSGLDNSLTINSSNILFDNVQTAQNSKFKFNNVEMESSSNTIEHLITGTTIELFNEGKTNFDIYNDDEKLNTQILSSIELFNNLSNSLNEMKDYTKEGSFQGNSNLIYFQYKLNSFFNNFDSISMGIEFQDGKLFLDQVKFKNFLENSDNREKTEKFFDNINNFLNNSVKETGPLSIIENNLENEKNNLNKNLTRTMEIIEMKNKRIENQFILYNSVINQMNNNFAPLESIIAQQFSQKG